MCTTIQSLCPWRCEAGRRAHWTERNAHDPIPEMRTSLLQLRPREREKALWYPLRQGQRARGCCLPMRALRVPRQDRQVEVNQLAGARRLACWQPQARKAAKFQRAAGPRKRNPARLQARAALPQRRRGRGVALAWGSGAPKPARAQAGLVPSARWGPGQHWTSSTHIGFWLSSTPRSVPRNPKGNQHDSHSPSSLPAPLGRPWMPIIGGFGKCTSAR